MYTIIQLIIIVIIHACCFIQALLVCAQQMPGSVERTCIHAVYCIMQSIIVLLQLEQQQLFPFVNSKLCLPTLYVDPNTQDNSCFSV